MTVADPINMEEFENAIWDWFSKATELETVWRQQSSPQPAYPFGSLSIIAGPVPYASRWETRTEYLSGAEAGKEIKMKTVVPCRFTISCQSYVKTNDSRNPNLSAQSYMRKAQASLSMESVLSVFDSKNIAVYSPGPVQNINEVIEDAFVSRANMDVVFGASLYEEEFTGYIDKVQVKSTELGINMEIDASS